MLFSDPGLAQVSVPPVAEFPGIENSIPEDTSKGRKGVV